MLIGLGTGRCGSASFAKLMGLPHESAFLPWEQDRERFEFVWPKVVKNGGDVGTYWIRYVDWVLERDPNARFVCLERDREKVIRSWVRNQRGRERFEIPVVWRKPDGSIGIFDSMPRLDSLSIRRAVTLYVDAYGHLARDAEGKYEGQFRIFDAESVLNDEAAQMSMMEFAERKMPLRTDIRAHSYSDDDSIVKHNVINYYSVKALREGKTHIEIPPHLLEQIGVPSLTSIQVKLQ